jgi:hypothetical protein
MRRYRRRCPREIVLKPLGVALLEVGPQNTELRRLAMYTRNSPPAHCPLMASDDFENRHFGFQELYLDQFWSNLTKADFLHSAGILRVSIRPAH